MLVRSPFLVESSFLVCFMETVLVVYVSLLVVVQYSWVFFFKQKTAYEMLRSLVGSEMFIRDMNYKHATDVTSKKWKTDALYSLGVLFYNNGADVLRKATPLASSNKEKYASEKAKADAAFKKAVDYLGEAVTLSPNRTEIKQMQDQVKAMIK